MPNNNEPHCPNIDYYVEWTSEKASKEEKKRRVRKQKFVKSFFSSSFLSLKKKEMLENKCNENTEPHECIEIN